MKKHLLGISSLLLLYGVQLSPFVLSAAPSTVCTRSELEAAIAQGGEIVFNCSGIITLTNTLLLAQDTSLDAGGNDVTLSGGSQVRLFQVNSNVHLTVVGLKLIDGRHTGPNGQDGPPVGPGLPGQGGCLLNLGGHVMLTDCLVAHHSAVGGNAGLSGTGIAEGGSALGGAICNLGGQLILDRCILQDNAATGGLGSPDPAAEFNNGDAGNALGGAVYSAQGSLELIDSSLLQNISRGGAAQRNYLDIYSKAGDAAGGALWAADSTLLVQNCLIRSNTTAGATSPWSGRGTGAARGGAFYLETNVVATFLGCTLEENTAESGASPRNAPIGAGQGGAILNHGTAQVANSTFTANQAIASRGELGNQGRGGAICSDGQLTINGSTFDHNATVGSEAIGLGLIPRAGFPALGGAVWSGGALHLTNSTFTANLAQGGNAAYGEVGGLGRGGAIHVNNGSAEIVHVTIAHNQALGGWSAREPVPPRGPSYGAGLSVSNGLTLLAHSIIASNAPGGDANGTIADGGYNLSSDATPTFSASSSRNEIDPLLGPLSDNGGPTLTMALRPGSPALNAIPSGVPLTDQRGVSRPQGMTSDIGAFESEMLMALIVMDGSTVRITFRGEAGRTYRLLRSADLNEWTVVDSQTPDLEGPSQFLQSLTLNSPALYRIAVD